MPSYYKAGSWNAVCDICGLRFKSELLQRNWKGQMVCAKDYEAKHPQLMLRVKEENTTVPWVRPENDIEIAGTALCTAEGTSCIADYAVADCAVCDLTPTFL